jgi:hypothetical protein
MVDEDFAKRVWTQDDGGLVADVSSRIDSCREYEC